MCRFGMAKRLKVGGAYHGIVLSSEATEFLSPADHDIINEYGIAGINCSWNRFREFCYVFSCFSFILDWPKFLFTRWGSLKIKGSYHC
jgi:ribosome biogenesis protein Tsr3